eukprot:COSAG03_NODE_5742_length_1183_cov_3.090484_1_plen_79_part_10
MRRGVFMFEIPNLLEYEPERSQNPSQNQELSVRFGAMEGSSRAGQLTVWEGDTGKENVGQGVRSEKRKRESSSYLGVSW